MSTQHSIAYITANGLYILPLKPPLGAIRLPQTWMSGNTWQWQKCVKRRSLPTKLWSSMSVSSQIQELFWHDMYSFCLDLSTTINFGYFWDEAIKIDWFSSVHFSSIQVQWIFQCTLKSVKQYFLPSRNRKPQNCCIYNYNCCKFQDKS